jgi:hypothetical protein
MSVASAITWVVREFLPTMPVGVCPRYGNMPVCREFRYFIEDGRYCCSHPYWPMESLIDGGFDLSVLDFTALCAGRTQELDRIAIAAGKAVARRLRQAFFRGFTRLKPT